MATDITIPLYLSILWIIIYILSVQYIFGRIEANLIGAIHIAITLIGVRLMFLIFKPKYPA